MAPQMQVRMSKSPSRAAASGSPGASRSRGHSVAAEPEPKRGKKEALTPQDTRSKLMHAAMRVFAREGFAAAITRMIATESGVNLQAIIDILTEWNASGRIVDVLDGSL